MSHHPDTRAYVERRVAEGRSTREIRQCLKRYLTTSIKTGVVSTSLMLRKLGGAYSLERADRRQQWKPGNVINLRRA